MKVFFKFQVYMKFEKIFNATFITNIPKKAGVVEMRWGTFPYQFGQRAYKIISKVLANHLSVVMEKIIVKS